MNSLRRVVLVLLGIGLADLGLAATFAVTNTNDSGDGSLRQAILDANMTPGADLIAFAIPGAGVHTITIESGLPTITEPVAIDGFTQPGASPNTNPPGQGFNTVIEIEIHCTGAGNDSCLSVAAGNTTVVEMLIQGLAINECFDACIALLEGADGTLITNNFIGTDPAGTVAVGQGHGDGIVVLPGFVAIVANLISGSFRGITAIAPNTIIKGNLIGTNAAGTSPIPNQIGIYQLGGTVQIGDGTAAGLNVISGNTDLGVELIGDDAELVGNLIGTDVTGTKPLGNHTGVGVQSLLATIQGNVISANDLGVQALSGSATAVDLQSNFIGTDLTGTIDLGNTQVGVQILDQGTASWNVGGLAPGSGNVIAHNRGLGGVAVASDETRVRIRGNRMFQNFPLGIDLVSGGDVVTANDTGDGDDGPNHLQNFPLISSVVPAASATHIEGTLNSTSSTSFDLDLYSTSCLAFPQDYLQGEEYLGSVQVTTDGIGNASFAADVPFVLTPDQQVTATATDPDGNTSEFAQRMVFLCFPAAGPSGGGTTAVLYGMLYDPLATVTVGGVPSTDVTVTSPTMLVATMPALPPGTRNDVVVTNPSGGLSGTLANGWISDFLDVPESHPFYLYVVILFRDDITAGAGGGNYGVDASTLRQQMAVFILKSKHGICYTPPPCTGVFADVPCANPFAPWIEAMASEGITGGCGGGNFCPQNPVRRDQMAVFLLKGEHGSSYVPPPCAGIFGDVPCPGPFADWIEQLSAEEITGGCGGGNYCPLDPNTRGQMAVFLAKTFHLL